MKCDVNWIITIYAEYCYGLLYTRARMFLFIFSLHYSTVRPPSVSTCALSSQYFL